MIQVLDLRVAGPHRLAVSFSDGSRGEHDFSELATRTGSMARPLADPAFFARAFVCDGVVTWPNGYDWDSAALHGAMAEAGELSWAEAAE